MTDEDPVPPAPVPRSAVGPRLAPGLHLVATPIGAARDITLHALDLLGSADLLAAEDTRTLRHLMEIHGVPLRGRMVVAHHDHAGPGAAERILAVLREGGVVAYASDAGTPLVSDPGFDLVRLALAEDLPVHAAPGPSALLAALTVAGLPTDRFFFAGFLPTKARARRTALRDLAAMPATVVLYESPHRIHACLDDLAASFGPDRRVALCRELTKRHEEVLRGSLADLVAGLSGRDVKGEIVLVLERAPEAAASAEDLDTALSAALQVTSVKEAATQVAERLGLPRRQVYQRALALQR